MPEAINYYCRRCKCMDLDTGKCTFFEKLIEKPLEEECFYFVLDLKKGAMV